MAIRVRKDGTMICAAHSEAEAGDTYIDDGLHYEMSQIHRVITSLPMPEHEADPRWWWSGSSADAQAEIACLQAEVDRLNALVCALTERVDWAREGANTAHNAAIEAAALIAGDHLDDWANDLQDTCDQYMEAQKTGRLNGRRLSPSLAVGLCREFKQRAEAVAESSDHTASAIRALKRPTKES